MFFGLKKNHKIYVMGSFDDSRDFATVAKHLTEIEMQGVNIVTPDWMEEMAITDETGIVDSCVVMTFDDLEKLETWANSGNRIFDNLLELNNFSSQALAEKSVWADQEKAEERYNRIMKDGNYEEFFPESDNPESVMMREMSIDKMKSNECTLPKMIGPKSGIVDKSKETYVPSSEAWSGENAHIMTPEDMRIIFEYGKIAVEKHLTDGDNDYYRDAMSKLTPECRATIEADIAAMPETKKVDVFQNLIDNMKENGKTTISVNGQEIDISDILEEE